MEYVTIGGKKVESITIATPEEREQIAKFVVGYVKHRVEYMAERAVKGVEGITIMEYDTLSMQFTVTVNFDQLKRILSGEYDFVLNELQPIEKHPPSTHQIRLD